LVKRNWGTKRGGKKETCHSLRSNVNSNESGDERKEDVLISPRGGKGEEGGKYPMVTGRTRELDFRNDEFKNKAKTRRGKEEGGGTLEEGPTLEGVPRDRCT